MLMRYFVLIILLVALISCNENKDEGKEKENEQNIEQYQALKTLDRNGRYTEWYPGHKQIKIKGRKDEEGRRQGIWKLFTKDGIELSVTVYTDGKKNGHIIVRYPTGIVRYAGRYDMDERVGEWKFYDQSGQLIKTENYGNAK
tara:strand:+ start:37409 stop:37837 length:429 start_codon:yes stop_codon:yes gene_type:complete